MIVFAGEGNWELKSTTICCSATRFPSGCFNDSALLALTNRVSLPNLFSKGFAESFKKGKSSFHMPPISQ